LRSLFFVAVVSALPLGCGGDGDGDNGDVDVRGGKTAPPDAESAAALAAQLSEKPWEILSNKGETYVPNVFYADPSENEQIMPYAIDGHVMIDRLIYPTLGNPNLYTKADPKEELVIALRVEEDALSALGARIEPIPGQARSKLVVPDDARTGFGFFLVSRAGRSASTEASDAIAAGEGTGAIRIYPHEIFVSPEPSDMPGALRSRKTLKFVFKQGAMAKVPAGLYDLRFEGRTENRIARTRAGAPLIEWQFNAVRVFDNEPDEYNVIGVTDTQVSVGDLYDDRTLAKLEQFVNFVNTTNDASVRKAQFITFNGDLHNGGSPASLLEKKVAWTYDLEAKEIVNLLKYLPLPIFLTTGNHDGYVSTGQVPSAVASIDSAAGTTLRSVINAAYPKAWPDLSMPEYEQWLARTASEDRLGGLHRDIFTGGFARDARGEGFAGFREIARSDRNYILYDGFYQWQKTYGPLYYSHKFGKNFYISLNSFELRQHRRSGWGMYTVNYGGAMSDVQMAWLDRELLRSKTDGTDAVILAHHDPRGGHEGLDHGYYFEQLDFKSVYQSAINYLIGKGWNAAVCKLPDWALWRNQEESCAHDGLQEWMRNDPEFDCASADRNPDRTCKPGAKPWLSAIELANRFAASPQIRTILLGHTHHNSLEILQQGDELLPSELPVDSRQTQQVLSLEILNPVRGYSEVQAVTGSEYDPAALAFAPLEGRYVRFADTYRSAIAGAQRTLSSPVGNRELAILRIVSNAELTNQETSSGQSAAGFAVLSIAKKADLPRIDSATYFTNVGEGAFARTGTITLERTKRVSPADPNNPIAQFYR
jgi:hypothetical protein